MSEENVLREIKHPIYDQIFKNEVIKNYVTIQNEALQALGYTEHSFAHVGIVTERVKYILDTLDYPEHQIDLGMSAAYLHDIGNIVNRSSHSQSGGVMAFELLHDLNLDSKDIAHIAMAIGNHDEGNGFPVNAMTAALIIADKSDVRRSRVQEKEQDKFDIHDRVNYAVTDTLLKINQEKTGIKLKMTIDNRYCAVGEFFEIFMERMLLCRRSAAKLNLEFHLIINEQSLM